MPPRSSRNKKHNNDPVAHRTSPPLSPPTHLPTPLPDERIHPQLIDLDTPPPTDPMPLTEDHELHDSYDEDLADTYILRSPPFREADLPQDHVEDVRSGWEKDDKEPSPPPLPVLPRTPHSYARVLEDEDGEEVPMRPTLLTQGQTRTPSFVIPNSSTRHTDSSSSSSASPSSQFQSYSYPYQYTDNNTLSHPDPNTETETERQSTLESLSRTIRGYGPSPPLVSRPIASGLFSGSGPGMSAGEQRKEHRRAVSQQEFEREYEREDVNDGYMYAYGSPGGYAAGGAGEDGYGYYTRGVGQQRQRAETEGGGGRYATQPVQAHVKTHQPQPHPPPVDVRALGFPVRGQVSAQTPRVYAGADVDSGSGLAQAMRRSGVGSSAVEGGHYGQEQRERGRGHRGRGVGRAQGQVPSPASAQGHGHGHRLGHGGDKRHPAQADVITWAKWDYLNERRILLLAYLSPGLQIWDCADLNKIKEVLNLDFNAQEWGNLFGSGGQSTVATSPVGSGGGGRSMRVVHAAVLSPPGGGTKDVHADVRPLLGILMESADEDEREHEPRSIFVLYSLRLHQVVKMVSFSGLSSTFDANEHVVVVSITTPPTLHILSPTTFNTLHTINTSSLEPFTPPVHRATSHSHSHSLNLSSALSIPNVISTSISTSSTVSSSASAQPVLLGGLSIENAYIPGGSPSPSPVVARVEPQPVFALSNRLLAYASPSPAASPSLLALMSSKASRRLSSSSSASGPGSNGASSLSSSPFGLGQGLGLAKIRDMNITQADVGNAALKVGESVFSGMKFLGGMAIEAAKSRVGGAAPAGRPVSVGGSVGVTGTGMGGGRPVSRSAPDNPGEQAAQMLRERGYSNVSGRDQTTTTTTTVAPHTKGVVAHGHYVTVLDLGPLFARAGEEPAAALPIKIDEFNASRSQPVAGLRFAKDGTSLATITRDGHSVKVFKLHPAPSVVLAAQRAAAAAAPALGSAEDADGPGRAGKLERRPATQVYDLYRGRTSAVVEDVEWARDGRWIAIGTRNRTVHVFAVNPYGGKSDIRSHLEGRVRNVEIIEPAMNQLLPLARIRGSKTVSVSPEHVKAPLAFTFISPSDISPSPNLQPPRSPTLPPHIRTSSPSPPTPSSSSLPSSKLRKTTNYQDVLLFDPADGMLSLRRLTVDKHPVREQGLGLGGGVAASFGVASISLPGMGGAGKLSSSPSSKASTAFGGRNMTAAAAASKAADVPMELEAKESVVATWDLQRGRDWVEIKVPLRPLVKSAGAAKTGVATNLIGRDWLASGELSTCSASQRVLPRSLYLSHQFSFHTLGEDYHALIRGYQFDIVGGGKIEVRKEVEVSAYPHGYSGSPKYPSGGAAAAAAGGGLDSAFVQDFDMHTHTRRISSSFDEPIASAISGNLNVDSSNLPTILPMYPNGVPGAGSKPMSFKSSMSIPIRTMAGIGDGMSEGIGRIRREMGKAREGRAAARSPTRDRPYQHTMSGVMRDDLPEESVPLEFDEEDEDFAAPMLMPAVPSRDASSRSRGTSGDSGSLSSLATPAESGTHHLSMDADVMDAVDERLMASGDEDGNEGSGWDREDRLAIEEAEGYDDLALLVDGESREGVLVPAAGVVGSAPSKKRAGRQKRRG